MKKRNLVRLAAMVFPAREETAGLLESFWGNTGTAVTLTSIDDVQPYLSAASGGETADDPLPLKVNFELGWQDLLSAIERAGKYVALDVSLCSMSGAEFSPATEFDPGAANTGESRIVSLALPNAAASIKAVGSYYANSTFSCFTALKSVSGDYVQTIGNHAFRGCAALTRVSFPAATSIGVSAFDSCAALTTVNLPAAASIGNYAFDSCAALTTVSLPAAATIDTFAFDSCAALTTVSLPVAASIGYYAFLNCSALTTVSLPVAASIGAGAFDSCAALTTVSLPKAASIGNEAFFDCAALTMVSLPATAPTLGHRILYGVSKTVTVKVPSGAIGYGPVPATYRGGNSAACWGNGFRGGGWNGSAFIDSDWINSNITLQIQEQ